MLNLDFKTESGQAKAMEIAKEIFHNFDNVEMEFTDYGTIKVTVDDVFNFRFGNDDLLQTKQLILLLELKKLEKLG